MCKKELGASKWEASKEVVACVVAFLLIIFGPSLSSNSYMLSHEEVPLSIMHVVYDNNGRIYVTSDVEDYVTSLGFFPFLYLVILLRNFS